MSKRSEAEHAAAAWIARRDTRPWTEADAAALAAWLEESAGNRAAYYRLNGAWQEAGRLKAFMGSEPGPRPAPAESRRLRYLAVAATAVLAVCSALWVFQGDLFGGARYSTVVGGLQKIAMTDGSVVTLNTASEVRIAMTQSQRRVELEHGEAFFEVAKDPARPFVVSAGGRRIIAVGTAFSVRRDRDDIRVAVAEGKVRMEIPGKEAALTQALAAGSIVRTASDAVLLQKKSLADIEQNLSWRSGMLTFRDTPLAEAVDEFNRYNVRKIVIDDPRIAAIEIGGIFRATSLDPFIYLLQKAFPIHADVEDERIVLKQRD